MNRTAVLKVLNPVLGAALLCQILTGVCHAVIPPETFEAVHIGGAIVLVAVAIAHVSLNWNWISANYFKRRP